MAEKDVLILAIESSCDETAAAVVKNGREVLSNVISSQIALHTLYGGVVPEIASRKHIEKINQVIQEALDEAHVTLDDIDAIPTARPRSPSRLCAARTAPPSWRASRRSMPDPATPVPEKKQLYQTVQLLFCGQRALRGLPPPRCHSSQAYR